MTIPGFVEEIITKIEDHGFEAFAVGGCVRDLLLGKCPIDWDIATSATPDIIMDIFKDFRVVPTGVKHGTVTVITNQGPFEITTYRIDGKYCDGRHPDSVTFAKSITDDLARRDFTINAMAYNKKMGLVDPFDGRKDLNQKIIRCVGDPSIRFKEDALRIMRALRFAATLDFSIEPQTASNIFSCQNLLEKIARERIYSELSKLVLANNPSKILTEYSAVFMEALGIKTNHFQKTWEANVYSLCRAEKSLPLRLSLLFYGLDAPKILKNLKLDNFTISKAVLLNHYLDYSFSADKIFIKKLMSQIGKEDFLLILKAKQARLGGQSEPLEEIKNIYEQIIKDGECFSLKDLAINGSDIKNRFPITGKQIGTALNLLLDAVIREECENTKASLFDYIEKNE